MILKIPNTFRKRLLSSDLYLFGSRRKSQAVVFGAAYCVGSVIAASNTVALTFTKYLLQTEREGRPVYPSRKLKILSETAAVDLKVPNTGKASFKLFCVETMLPEAIGSLNSSYGALVGIPDFLNADNSEEVFLDETQLQSFTEEENKLLLQLKENSVFSESSKLYVIGEVLATVRDAYHYVVPCLISFLGVHAAASQTMLLVKYTSVRKVPILLRAPIYSFSLILWTALSMGLLDQYREKYLFRTILNDLNEKYIDGGIEFYEKSLKRSQIIEDLFGYAWSDVGSHYATFIMKRRLSALKKRKKEFS